MFILFIDTREDLDKYTIATIKKCKRVEYKFKYKNNTLLERERERERELHVPEIFGMQMEEKWGIGVHAKLVRQTVTVFTSISLPFQPWALL